MAHEPVPRTLAAALCGLTLAVSGCLLQASYSIKVTTADDVVLEVPLAAKASLDASDEAMRIVNFRFVPLVKEQQKAMGYLFEIAFLGGKKPQSVIIDDVSELPILNLVDERAPKLVENNHWVGTTKPYDPADEHLAWVTTLDNGVRVFRFTVKLTDGSTHVLRLPIVMPGNTKAVFRAELGIK